MNKHDVYHYLDALGIPYEITEHKAVYNMAEVADIPIPYPEADAKNLFVRDDKKRNYYLITVQGDKKVDLKAFRQAHQTRPLSFASEQDLMDYLGLFPGAVTPLGVLNGHAHNVHFYLDAAFLQTGKIGVHPNDNTATVWLPTADLIHIIEAQGSAVTLAEFA